MPVDIPHLNKCIGADILRLICARGKTAPTRDAETWAEFMAPRMAAAPPWTTMSDSAMSMTVSEVARIVAAHDIPLFGMMATLVNMQRETCCTNAWRYVHAELTKK